MSRTTAAEELSDTDKKHDKRFEDSISLWTLKFHNTACETSFVRKYDTNFRIPFVGRLAAYVCIFYIVAYRVLALYTRATNSQFLNTGSLREELAIFLYVVGSFAAELVLKLTGWLVPMHGFFGYTCSPIVLICAAFFSQREPLFGMS